ncbi:hybrid sensor histidine kinase/response regulator [Methylobacterium sp. 17Sr1-1]|nr:PAS domain-containing protein [Methylobacterium sp. 17Sr1-1]AWN55407.1 hybrid sensor histidine kinase/response regulator [Methylobacterium sp. 17Sr1-1]
MVEGTCIRLWSAVERARAEARLRESEERLGAIFASATVGLSEVDLTGRFLRVNTELCRILGRSETALLQLGVADVTFPDDLAPSFAAVKQVIETGRSATLDKRYVRPDGSMCWANSSIQRLDDAHGHVRNLLVVTVDLSQRKATEEALRASEEFNRRVLASSADCVKVLDLDARLEFMSEGGMCVMEVDDFRVLAGKYWPDMWQGEQRTLALKAIEEAVQGHTGRFQGHAPTMKGTPRWWDVIVTPMAGADGRPEKLLSISRDVTAAKQAELRLRELNETLEERVAARTSELVQAEEALRQSQKMEAVGQLTGGVAHDFNNLLTIIRSSVDFLRRPELPELRRERYLNAVSETVDRAAKLTSQLLAFARRQALKPEVFDVGQKVRGIADMLDTVTGARIRVVTETPDNPCFIRADLSQFETALINMAVNARDAMAGEGLLMLRLACGSAMPPIRGHAGAQSAFAAVSLTDTGSGIPPEDLARIFEPFFTTKEVGKGTGLGLSQVFGFAKQSGGDVDVTSVVGEGTTFTLYLPEVSVDELSERETADNDGPAPVGGGQRVLVVEDNIEVGRFCTQILEDLGYRTEWATNAEDAIDKLGSDGGGFEVVFSDVVMPGMGGLALARIVKRRLPHLPVVLASGYSHVLAQEGSEGFELLQKPYSAEQLSKTLRHVTARTSSTR